jgi:hypothetical protein
LKKIIAQHKSNCGLENGYYQYINSFHSIWFSSHPH